MPAKSKKQRKLMGMVKAMQTGKMAKSVSPKIAKLAKSMSPASVDKFAKTSEKGLPTKVAAAKSAGKSKMIKRGKGKVV